MTSNWRLATLTGVSCPSCKVTNTPRENFFDVLIHGLRCLVCAEFFVR